MGPEGAGRSLREIRVRLGLTLKQVEAESQRISESRQNREYFLSAARLSQIENNDSLPSLFKLASLSELYQLPYRELLRVYGIATAGEPNGLATGGTQLVAFEPLAPPGSPREETRVLFPVRFEPGFDPRKSVLLNQMVAAWGEVPINLFRFLNPQKRLYGLIGFEDRMMEPLLRPGAVVEINPTRRDVEDHWSSEFDRPIYFVETPGRCYCSWCSLDHKQLALVPHTQSPARPVVVPVAEATIIGQVVGAVLRLVDSKPGRSRRRLPPKR